MAMEWNEIGPSYKSLPAWDNNTGINFITPQALSVSNYYNATDLLGKSH